MNVKLVSVQGFCMGVKRALDLVFKAKKENPDQKIYILGNVINNKQVTSDLFDRDIITITNLEKSRLEMIDEIDEGLVILTAHGVSPKVYKKLNKRNLKYIDATCPFVKKVSKRITKAIENNYDVIYIGKHNHPESEGVIGISNNIHLVTNEDEIKKLNIKNDNILIDSQTTLSPEKVLRLTNAIIKKYPKADKAIGLCDAVKKRQEALKSEIEGELCLVVGDSLSSNAKELVEIGEKKVPTYLIESYRDINHDWLKGVKTVTLTSAASTPSYLTNEVLDYLKSL